MLRLLFLLITCSWMTTIVAQADRWQQRVMYNMEIDVNVSTHTFEGKQRLVYINNSPDELNKVFYHLYYNAFQPGSMMDVRSRTVEDPDSRVGSRIYSLDTGQMGFTQVKSLKQNGRSVQFKEEGTIHSCLRYLIKSDEQENLAEKVLIIPCPNGILKCVNMIIKDGMRILMWEGSFMVFGEILM